MWILILFLATKTLAGQDCIDCSLPAQPSPNITPAPIVYTENRNCRPHLVGQGRVNNVAAQMLASSVPADREYLLYRRSEREYEVIFQLDFVAKAGNDAPAASDAVTTMEERTRQCLALMPPSRTPDGREMRFRFITPEQKHLLVGKAPPKIQLNVVKASRGNAENFAEDFRCGQIIHELLHQAGLCDEYHETSGALNVGHCRAQAQGSSVMGNGMHQAYDDSVGEPFTCDLSRSPDHKAYLNDPASAHKDFLLKRNFRDIGNRPWAAFGHSLTGSAWPKDVCCKVKTPIRWGLTVSNPDLPKVSLDINSTDHVQFKNKEAYFDINPADSTKKIVKYNETEYECKISDVEESLRPACVEYLELLRPELESVADPNRRMFACPRDLPQSPFNFDITPGSFELSGDTLHVRNRGNGRSLLHAGHFERLLAGHCSSPAAAVYDRCSRFAYGHNYTHAQKSMSCETLLPDECKRVDWIGALAQ